MGMVLPPPLATDTPETGKPDRNDDFQIEQGEIALPHTLRH